MCWQRAATIPAAPDASRRARAFVTDAIDTVIGDRLEFTGDAELVVSELVANAVQAGAPAVMVSLDLHRSHLRLAVEDDADGVPALMHAATTDDHGRGLEIVAGLTTAWGVSPAGSGKEVWADLAISESLNPGLFPCSVPATEPHRPS